MSADFGNEIHETKESVNKGKHGSDYELEVAKFLLKRVIDNDFEDFKFTREKTGLGKFDDLTLIYKQNGKSFFRLFQVKHIENKDKKISHAQLSSDKNSYFLLSKYFSHYLQSLANIERDKDFKDARLQDLIICTNVDFEFDLKGIALRRIDKDSIFQNGFDLFKLEIPTDIMRIIFKDEYYSPLEKLARELLNHVLLDKQINIATLIKYEAVSLIKDYHLALAKSVIDTERRQFQEQFLRGDDSINVNTVKFRNIVFRIATEMHSSLNSISDKELQNKLNIKSIEHAKRTKNLLESFETKDKFEVLLKAHTFKLTGNFGKIMGNFNQAFFELPTDICEENDDNVDIKIKSFLDKLIFAVEQTDIEKTVRKELGDHIYHDFHYKMHDWYHKGCLISKENGQVCRVRKWITKEVLLNRTQEFEVQFQDQKIKLKELTDGNDHLIDPDTLLKVFCSKNLNIGGEIPCLGEVEKYYIERTLVRPVEIRTDILEENIKDVFVISNISDGDTSLDKLLSANEKLHHTNEQTKSARLMYTNEHYTPEQFSYALERLQEFLKQQRASTIEVPLMFHWLEKTEGKLIWKQTYGSLSGLRRYLSMGGDKNNDHHHESEMLERNENKIKIVFAEPGMGKSTLLDHIAQKTTTQKPLNWVIKVDLKRSSHYINELDVANIGISETVKFLSKAANFQSKISATLLKFHMNNKGKMTLLFDGFDELLSYDQQEKIANLVLFVKESIPKCTVWITTRPHMKEFLEEKLSTFAFSIKEISDREQIYFLTRFWNAGAAESDAIEAYATRLIAKFSCSINDYERRFLGIPLQIKLLAGAFKEEIISMRLSVPENIDLHYLYKTFIDAKYNIFFSKHNDKPEKKTEGSKLDQFRYSAMKSVNNAHEHFALTSGILFPSEETKNIVKQTVDFPLEQLLDIGIIYKFGGQIHFIHRTFAEYFAANRMVNLSRKKLQNPRKYSNVIQFLERHIFEQRNLFILYLFDHLVPDHFSMHYSALKGHMEQVVAAEEHDINEQDLIGRAPIYYAIAYKKLNIIKYLLSKNGVEVNVCNKFMRWAVSNMFSSEVMENDDWEDVLKTLLEKIDTRNLTEEQKLDLLSARAVTFALMYEMWDIVHIMIGKGAEVNRIEDNSDIPLVIALELRSPLKIIKSLINITSNDFFNEKMLRNSPGIHCVFGLLLDNYKQKGICELIQLMAQKGVDLNVQDADGQTLLHLIIGKDSMILNSFFPDQGYEDEKILIVKCLLENGAIYNLRDKSSRTPLDQFEFWKQLRLNAFLRDRNRNMVRRFSEQLCFGNNLEAKYYNYFKNISKIDEMLTLINDVFKAVKMDYVSTDLHKCLEFANLYRWTDAILCSRNSEGKTVLDLASSSTLALLKQFTSQ